MVKRTLIVHTNFDNFPFILQKYETERGIGI